MIRGNEFWRLGLYEEARNEFEDLRKSASLDPVQTYLLVNHFYDRGVYRSAILGSRQLLTLAGMDDTATLNAPVYFNRIRFGAYYGELVHPAALEKGFSSLLLFSLIRQESLFEGFVQSHAGARGLMQIMPATGEGIVSALGWPPNFSTQDLYRPVVSIRLGTYYLAQQRAYFGGDLYTALAAYNGGPGNTIAWKELAPDDPDLFLEVIRIQETRDYIKRIYEIFTIYRRLFGSVG
jgi:soluble lytic murein transglycosylase